jgi:penicillin-binding protein 1B
MAIGSYDATPLEMAGAYTVFANNGLHWTPGCWPACAPPPATSSPTTRRLSKQVLDPRVAYLTTSMMENVIDHGTGAGVRARGFTAPAAGKTGTSHDAWFAGFTSNLLCIVWVGNDDYTDVKIEGAHAAAPIWAEFMKKAVLLPQYSDTNDFTRPRASRLSRSTRPATCSATPPARTASMPPSWPAPRPRRPATTPPMHRNL